MSLKLIASSSDEEKHECDVTTMIFCNNKLYTASDDGKVKKWNTDLNLEKEIQAHSYSIYSLTSDNKNIIYTCSSDGSVRSWKADSLEESGVVLETGDHEIWKIYWGDEQLAILDDQGVITLQKDDSTKMIVEMMEQIKDIALKDNLLYTVRDVDLVITEILPGSNNRYTCRCTLHGRAPLTLIDDKICYSSRDGKDIFINNRKENNFAQISHIEKAHELIINTLAGCVKNNKFNLFSGGWDKTVKWWQLVGGKTTEVAECVLPGYINCLCVSDDCKNVFASGAEGKIWKLAMD